MRAQLVAGLGVDGSRPPPVLLGDVAAIAVEPAVVEPVDPFRNGQLDLVHASPRPAGPDQLGLVQPVDRFRERVVIRISSTANRSRDTGLGEPLGEPDRGVLRAAVGVNLNSG